MFEDLLHSLSSFAQVFWDHGKQIFLVGGAVRDRLLGKSSDDFDFTTDATPQEVLTFFRKVILTGIQHGTVTVLFQGNSYEVTTFRLDGIYADHRRPDQVVFTPSLEKDLMRRDFTINAIALDLKNGNLIDFHNGKKDLEIGILKAIGIPSQRFEEDALRILRLFRFAARLNFKIDPESLSAACSKQLLLSNVSRERIHEELIKLVGAEYPSQGIQYLQKIQFSELFFFSISFNCISKEELKVIDLIPASNRWPVILILWFPNLEIKEFEKKLRYLTFTNNHIKSILNNLLIFKELIQKKPSAFTVKHFINVLRTKENNDLTRTICLLPQTRFPISKSDADGWLTNWNKVIQSNEPVFMSEMQITGFDLLEKGWPENRNLGKILNQLQHEIWINPGLNTKDQLLVKAEQLKIVT